MGNALKALIFSIVLLFSLALAMPGLASTTGRANATQDSWVTLQDLIGTITLGDCGSVGINTTFNYGNCTRLLIHLPNGGGDLNSRNFFQFNTSSMQNKVITSMNLVLPSVTAIGISTRTLVYNSNNNWNESNITGENYNLDSTASNQVQTVTFGTGSVTSTQFVDLLNGSYQMVGDIYNGLVTIQISNPTPCSGSCQPGQLQSSTSEDTNPPYLTAILDDVTTAQVTSTGNNDVYFDFESNYISSANFAGADFHYNLPTNTLSLIAPGQLVGSSSNPANTLLTTNCVVGFNTGDLFNINIPAGTYNTYCFDLSSQHLGSAFRGMIKIINNTGTVFKFYWLLADPAWSTFSNIAISPTPAIEGQNLTVTWQTTQPLTSSLRIRYNDTNTGTWTAFATYSNSTLTTDHTLVIPDSIMFPTEYEIDIFGIDSVNNSFYADPYFFNATTSFATLSVQTLGVFTFNEFGFPTPAGISLDGGLAQTTTQFENVQGQTVYGVSFARSLVPFGYHNITARDYASSARSGSTVVNVQSYPTFVSLTLRPHNSCVAAGFFAQPDFCNQTMSSINYSSIGATGKFCQYNPDECNLYNYTNGNCMTTAGQRTPPVPWVLYLCYDNYNPTGVLIGPDTSPGGVVITVGSPIAGQNPAVTAFQFLGFNAEQTVNFIAMILTLIVTITVGILTKDGAVTGIVFIGTSGIFTIISWLPWWFILIEVILAAFIISKFTRQSFTPQ